MKPTSIDRDGPAGLRYGTVTVCSHRPEWTDLFEQLAGELRLRFGGQSVAIEHVGSTSVPDLAAKPIIDIAAGIVSGTSTTDVIEALSDTPWIYRGNKGDDGGLLFVRESQPQVRIAHLHVVEFGGARWAEYLALRQLLRSDPLARTRYQDLKMVLAQQFPDDRTAYTAGKTMLILQFLGQ